MATQELRIVARNPDIVGENPLWNPGDKRLYWTDNRSQRVHRLDPASGAVETVVEGQSFYAFTLQADGSLLLFMDRTRVGAAQAGGRARLVIDGLPGEREARFNDVVADRLGRVVAGVIPLEGGDRLALLDRAGRISHPACGRAGDAERHGVLVRRPAPLRRRDPGQARRPVRLRPRRRDGLQPARFHRPLWPGRRHARRHHGRRGRLPMGRAVGRLVRRAVRPLRCGDDAGGVSGAQDDQHRLRGRRSLHRLRHIVEQAVRAGRGDRSGRRGRSSRSARAWRASWSTGRGVSVEGGQPIQ